MAWLCFDGYSFLTLYVLILFMFCPCLAGSVDSAVLSLMSGFVWSDFAALPCGWLNSAVLTLNGLMLLLCLDVV